MEKFSKKIKMKTLTRKESEALLLLFKDLTKNYNANSISKSINITPRGALKILKNLKEKNLLISKQFGKAVFYKINSEDYYTFRTIETILLQESREKALRWLFEFKDLFKDIEIAIIFGSVLRDEKKARDIDVIFIFKKQKYKDVMNFIEQKNKILLSPIHPVIQMPKDFKSNLIKKNSALLNALKHGYILHGYDKLISVIKNVTSF